MKKRTATMVFLVLVLVAVLLMILFLVLKDEKIKIPVLDNKGGSVKDTGEENLEEDIDTETSDTTTSTSTSSGGSSGGSGGGSGGGGSGSSSSSSSGGEASCDNSVQITYFMVDPIKNINCTQFDGEICINKIVECSINVQNRDETTSGVFEIEILFVEQGLSSEDAFDSEIESFSLGPMSEKRAEASVNIQSTGIDGLANKNINCFYNTLQVPQKCV